MTTPTPPRTHQSLIFEVTQRCNHDCPHCYNVWKNERAYPGGELDTASLLTLMDKTIAESGASHVTLTGGEPLLRKDLEVIIRHLRSRGVVVNLISNGTLLDAPRVESLVACDVGPWELPLLSDDRNIHDRMSGLKGAFEKLTMAVAMLKARRQMVVLVFVATRLNLPQFPGVLEMALALGADGMMFNRMNPGGRGWANFAELSPSPADVAAALDTAQAFSKTYEFPVSVSIPMPPCLFDSGRWPGLSFGFCAAGTERAYYTVDPAGNLRPCNHSSTILGNLKDKGFWEMVDSPQMADFKASHAKYCDDCAAVGECAGSCKAAAEVCLGSTCDLDPYVASQLVQVRKPARLVDAPLT